MQILQFLVFLPDLKYNRSNQRKGGRFGGCTAGIHHRDAPHHQGVSGHHRQRRHNPAAQAGRDPRPAGRERRGQEHAHERAVRPLPAGAGHHQEERRGGQDKGPQRRHGAAHRHGPPALQAGRRVHGAGQHHPRRGDDEAGLHPEEGGPQARGGALRALRPQGRPRRQGRGHHRRYAAARRDTQDALPRQRDTHIRRADRRPHPAGDRGAHGHDARVRQRGQEHPLHLPQAQRDHGGLRPRHRPAQGQVHRHGQHEGHQPAGALQHDGRAPRPARRRKGPGQAHGHGARGARTCTCPPTCTSATRSRA